MQQNNDRPVSVRLTRAQRRILEQAAAQRGLNHSDYLRQIIEEAGAAAAAEGGDAPDPLGAAQVQEIVRSEVEGALNRRSADLANRVALAVQRNSSAVETQLNEPAGPGGRVFGFSQPALHWANGAAHRERGKFRP